MLHIHIFQIILSRGQYLLNKKNHFLNLNRKNYEQNF